MRAIGALFEHPERSVRTIVTVVAAVAVVMALVLVLGGIYLIGQLHDLSSSLSRLTTQLNTLEAMNAKLDTLQTMTKKLETMDGRLARTNQSLERMGGDIRRMTERITRSKLLF